MGINDLDPFPPASFFNISTVIKKKVGRRSYLPDTSSLLSETSFARIAALWGEEGMTLHAQVKKPLEEVLYPKYREGDSLEFFFDTRDLKNAQFTHRFCHHFVFLPEEIDGVLAREMTVFRSDEAHEIADPKLFTVQTSLNKRSYEMDIYIPKKALHGYAPFECKQLGFAYRINRYEGDPQHFTLSSRFFSIEKHPGLWATLILCS